MATESGPVAIVGAGLAGCVLASQLRKRGICVDMYERRPNPRVAGPERGRSINLAMSARGLAALEQIGLRQDAVTRSMPMRGRTVHPVDGRTAFQPYSAEGTRAIHSISRSELNQALLDCAEKAGARLHFEHRLTGVDEQTGELTLQTPQGPSTQPRPSSLPATAPTAPPGPRCSSVRASPTARRSKRTGTRY